MYYLELIIVVQVLCHALADDIQNEPHVLDRDREETQQKQNNYYSSSLDIR